MHECWYGATMLYEGDQLTPIGGCKCSMCDNLANWASIFFEAPFCCADCLDKMAKQYSDAQYACYVRDIWPSHQLGGADSQLVSDRDELNWSGFANCERCGERKPCYRSNWFDANFCSADCADRAWQGYCVAHREGRFSENQSQFTSAVDESPSPIDGS